MKKIICKLGLLLAMGVTVAVTACSSSEDLENEIGTSKHTVHLTFTAQQEQGEGTRAIIDAADSKQINWQEGDEISVFDGSANQKFTLTSGEGTPSGIFDGEAAEATAYTALYPYQAAAIENNGKLTANIPATQTATANSFDPAAALMMAEVSDNNKNFQFRNCVAYIKVTIDEPAKSISFASLDGRSVAGTVTLDYNQGEPTAEISAEGSLSATLQPKSGEETIAAGTYYIAVLPQAMELGFKLAYVDADGITHNRIYTGTNFTAKRNKVSNMGTINAGNTYTNRQIVYYADSKYDDFLSASVLTSDGKTISLKNLGTEATHEFNNGIGVLTFNNDVKSINSLFHNYYNENLTTITKVILPESTEKVSSFSFCNSQIEELYIPQSVTELVNAIKYMPKLKKLVLPANFNISEDFLCSCPMLEAIYGPNTNSEHNAIIKDHVLIAVATGNLTSYAVPAGISKIGIRAFEGTNLQKVTLPPSVTTIADYAFISSNITSLTIPKSVKYLGESCFQITKNLETLSFEEGSQITQIPGWAFNWSKAIVNIPASVTSIGDYAFYAYNSYRTTKAHIVIPDNVETIEKYAFYQAINIESITLGAKVSNVSSMALGGIKKETKNTKNEDVPSDEQTNLKYIYSKNPTPPTLDNDTFKNTNIDELEAIFVPAESVDDYKTADTWSQYADKIQAMPNGN